MAEKSPREAPSKKEEDEYLRMFDTDLTKHNSEKTEIWVDVRDDFRQFSDEMLTMGPGGESMSSLLQRETPFLLDNVNYCVNVYGEKIHQLRKEPVFDHTESRYYTLDEWNQVTVALYEKVLGVHDDPVVEPFTAVLRSSGQERFHCGSLFEKTATSFRGHQHYGGTDVDLMACAPLLGHPVDIMGRSGYVNLYSDDERGYRKNENNYLYSEHHNMSFLHMFQGDSQRWFHSSLGLAETVHDITGPAIGMFTNATQKHKSSDVVHGYYFTDRPWPPVAQEWLTRSRASGWPSPSLIKRIRSHGTYVVPVAHPLSDNPDIEWRYSFSKPELDLMRSVTDTQRKCYMLTKRHCNLMFEHYKSVSTYHVKTAFFWLLEELPPQGWVQMTMVELVNFLLERLANYFIFRKLPHYFIKDANIIDHIPEETMRMCVQKLEHLRRGEMPKYIKEDFCLNAIWETVPPCDEKVAKTSKYRVATQAKQKEEMFMSLFKQTSKLLSDPSKSQVVMSTAEQVEDQLQSDKPNPQVLRPLVGQFMDNILPDQSLPASVRERAVVLMSDPSNMQVFISIGEQIEKLISDPSNTEEAEVMSEFPLD